MSIVQLLTHENSLLIAGILGALFAMTISIIKLYGKSLETLLNLKVFKNRQQAHLMNIARHNIYNSNRILVRYILKSDTDERFTSKLKTREQALENFEIAAEKFAYFPKEILYRIEHLILLIRSVNIDAETTLQKKDHKIYYKKMFRRFMTIAVLADFLENYIDSCDNCGILGMSWQIITGKQSFFKIPDTVLDIRIDEINSLDTETCYRLFIKYINERHIEQLEGPILQHIENVLDYPTVKAK